VSRNTKSSPQEATAGTNLGEVEVMQVPYTVSAWRSSSGKDFATVSLASAALRRLRSSVRAWHWQGVSEFACVFVWDEGGEVVAGRRRNDNVAGIVSGYV